MPFVFFNTRFIRFIRGICYLCGANLVQMEKRDLHQICTEYLILEAYTMATVKFYLDTRRAKMDGSYPLRLHIKHAGKFLVSTDFTATPDTWEGSEYNNSARNYKTRNVMVRTLINKVETFLLSLDASGKLKGTSDRELKAQIERIVRNEVEMRKTFADYLDGFIESKTKQNTIACYAGTKAKVLAYDSGCTFNTMDKKWLDGFDKWMADQGLKVNTRSIHMRNIRSVFNYAIDNGDTEAYPFRKFSIGKEETRKRSLKVDQLRLLRDFVGEEYQREYQDMFMLMFYLVGINGIDLFGIREIVDGRVEYKREKTGKLYSIKVEPEALEIINKYRGKEYLLNVMERNHGNYRNYMTAMNRGLKRLGDVERKGLGGKKVGTFLFPGISSYWARHTWATIAASLDIPKETISAALGHEIGSRVTSIYIDFDQKKVDEANRKVIDYLNGVKAPALVV